MVVVSTKLSDIEDEFTLEELKRYIGGSSIDHLSKDFNSWSNAFEFLSNLPNNFLQEILIKKKIVDDISNHSSKNEVRNYADDNELDYFSSDFRTWDDIIFWLVQFDSVVLVNMMTTLTGIRSIDLKPNSSHEITITEDYRTSLNLTLADLQYIHSWGMGEIETLIRDKRDYKPEIHLGYTAIKMIKSNWEKDRSRKDDTRRTKIVKELNETTISFDQLKRRIVRQIKSSFEFQMYIRDYLSETDHYNKYRSKLERLKFGDLQDHNIEDHDGILHMMYIMKEFAEEEGFEIGGDYPFLFIYAYHKMDIDLPKFTERFHSSQYHQELFDSYGKFNFVSEYFEFFVKPTITQRFFNGFIPFLTVTGIIFGLLSSISSLTTNINTIISVVFGLLVSLGFDQYK